MRKARAGDRAENKAHLEVSGPNAVLDPVLVSCCCVTRDFTLASWNFIVFRNLLQETCCARMEEHSDQGEPQAVSGRCNRKGVRMSMRRESS